MNQVWSTDITYIRLHSGFLYLVVVMDWYSRYVLSWALSITMDVGFCLEALDQALEIAQPEIFNSDLQFAEAIGKPIQLLYYPPYHSKYNPIERC